MKLPSGITFEQTLLGSGTGTTVRGLENGQSVIVKSTDTTDNLFSGGLFEDDNSQESESTKEFEAEKKRELQAAEKSNYFLKGRLEKDDGNTFWIRPFMRRSLHDKVAFKETPDSAELAVMCRAIVKALGELAQVDNCGHGNLSLGNVLIQDKDIHDLKLVDLLTANERNSRDDKRALGLIIYQLVNGEFVELDDKIAAVPDDQDWKVLGATEQLWRDFCSELLNPYGKYAESDWTQIDQALKKIEAAYNKRKKLKATLIVSVFLAFGAVVFLIWKIKFQEEEIVVDLDTIQGQWIELLDNYFSWGGNYLKSKSSFEKTADSKDFLDTFYNDKKARLPMKIIGRVTGQGARMQTSPNQVYEAARRMDVLALDNSKQQQIVLAHMFVMELRGKIENWDVLQKLADANKSFTDSGFEFGANETQRLMDSISFEGGSLSLSLLYGLKKSAEGLDELQDLYTIFEAQVVDLKDQADSKFLPKYAVYLRERLSMPVEDPVSHLRALVTISAEALSYWEEEKLRIAADLFSKSERALVSRRNFSITESSLTEWKDLVRSFRLIEIRSLNSGRETFITAQRNVLELNEQINELQEPGLAPAKFDRQFEKLFEAFQDAVDMPLIEANREVIEAAVSKYLSDLKTLVETTEDRWAEVNPDIGDRLRQLSEMPAGLSPLLAPTWQTYLDREVNSLTEDSFSGPREFIVFQREYFRKLKNFEYFQKTQLSQLSLDWPDGALDTTREDLFSELHETRRAFYGDLVYDWIDQMAPILLNTDEPLAIEAATDGVLQRMQNYEVELLDYAQLLSDILNEFDSWKLPEKSLASLFDALNEGNLREQWSQSGSFAPHVNKVKIYLDLNQITAADALLAFVLDEENPAFARSMALEKIANQEALSPEDLGQVAEVLPDWVKQVPTAELDGFNSVLKSLWIRLFEDDDLDKDGRKMIFSYHDLMSVQAVDFSGRARFIFEVYSALAELQSNQELYLEDPFLLEEFITGFDSLPTDSQEPELEELLEALRSIDLAQVKETFESAPFIAKGWAVEKETEDQLILVWKDHRLVFHLLEDEERDFFVAEQESSIGLFNDWMKKNKLWGESAKDLPREWEVFISQAYNAIDDYRRGMKLWSIARRGLKRDGVVPASQWFEVDPVVADEYAQVEGELFPESEIDETMPMQHTGACLARFFAESMGMSLLTPNQWHLLVKNHSADKAFFWQSRFESELSEELVDEIRSGSYYVERSIEESGYGVDHPTMLAKVGEQSDSKFKHLAGNLAEYLYDPEAETYYVAGGSAFSVAFSTWKDEHLVPKRSELTAFSDVGVRLALIAPEQSAYMQYVNILNGVLK